MTSDGCLLIVLPQFFPDGNFSFPLYVFLVGLFLKGTLPSQLCSQTSARKPHLPKHCDWAHDLTRANQSSLAARQLHWRRVLLSEIRDCIYLGILDFPGPDFLLYRENLLWKSSFFTLVEKAGNRTERGTPNERCDEIIWGSAFILALSSVPNQSPFSSFFLPSFLSFPLSLSVKFGFPVKEY